MQQLSSTDVLRMIKDKKIQISEAKKMLFNIYQNNISTIYLTNNFVETKKIFANLPNANNILLLCNDENIAENIKKYLENNSKTVMWIKAGEEFRKINDLYYEINIKNEYDYKTILNHAKNSFGNFDIIHMFSYNSEFSRYDVHKDYSDISYNSIFLLAKAILKCRFHQEIKLLYLYNNFNPEFASVSGLLKSIPFEYPKISIKSIEIEEYSKKLVDIISHELQEFFDSEIKYVDNKRYVKKLLEVETFENQGFQYKENGVYVITGGAGGLGLLFAKHIAKKVNARIILLGRSPLNNSKSQEIKEIGDLGSSVEYYEVDISNSEGVNKVINNIIIENNKINGVIHSAGIIRDSFLINKELEDFNSVLSPKIKGLKNLYFSLKDIKMDFFITFSSIVAVLGNVGQADYATGNCFMDNFLKWCQRKCQWGRVLTINWPFWQQGGMQLKSENLEYMAKNYGMYPLSINDGIDAFECAIQSSFSQLVVVYGQREKISDFIPSLKRNLKVAPSIDEKSKKIPITDNVKVKKSSKFDISSIIKYLKNILSEEIGLAEERISEAQPFEEYGIDSIMIMNINAELTKKISDIRSTLLFEYPNIRSLAQYIADNYKEYFMEEVEESIVEEVNEDIPVDKDFELNDDIAIIGISGKYPEADDLNELWNNLCEGKDCIKEIPKERWNYEDGRSKWGGFINDVYSFDSMFFNISPKEGELIDPQERIFLEYAWKTIEDAGYTRERLKADVGVFVGSMYAHYQLWGVNNEAVLNSSLSSISNRVSYYFNFNGPSFTVDAMCSSSLTALHLACESIKNGECKYALVGGVNLSLHPYKYRLLNSNGFTSTDGKCRSFGEGGSGYVPGEGVGSILIKPLKEAKKDSDYIYAVIKGSAINHGGKTNGYTVPSPKAQAELIKKVLKKSNIDINTISYIETHGTGTTLGDPIEFTGLMKAFDKHDKDKFKCSIGSIKSNIGHLEAAAGIAGLTKVILQIQNKKLVPSIHASKLNSKIDFNNSPFKVQQHLEEWQGVNDKYRAGISSFGAGGANAHVIIEGYDNNILSINEDRYLILLSAKNENVIKKKVKDLYKYLENKNSINCNESELLSRLSYTLQIGREHMNYRIAIIVNSLEDMKEKLNNLKHKDVFFGKTEIIAFSYDTYIDNSTVETLLSLKKNNQLDEIASKWCQGVNFNWGILYKNKKVTTLSLPTYPFKKIYLNRQDDNSIKNVSKKISVYLDENISTFDSQSFTKSFTHKDVIVSDHVVDGKVIVPIAVLVEMILSAGNYSNSNKLITNIKNLSILKPVIINDNDNDSETNVKVTLIKKGEKQKAIISSNFEDDTSEYCSADLAFSSVLDDNYDVNKLDLFNLKKANYYKEFNYRGFEYGKTLRVIEEATVNGNISISKIKVDNTLDEFNLNPEIFDGALQTTMLFNCVKKDSNSRFLPVSIEDIYLRNTDKDGFFVVSELLEEESNDTEKVFNIYVYDEDGILYIKITRLRSKILGIKHVNNKLNEIEKLLKSLSEGKENIYDIRKKIKEL